MKQSGEASSLLLRSGERLLDEFSAGDLVFHLAPRHAQRKGECQSGEKNRSAEDERQDVGEDRPDPFTGFVDQVQLGDSEGAVDEDEVPSTAEEIVDPKWTGEIGVAPGNASFLAFVTAMRIVEATEQWLENLAAIDPQTFERNGGILEAVNAGEVEIGLINHYYWYKQAAEQGEENMRARLVYGEAGDVAGLVNATGVGIMKNAEDNENALAFVEFLLSEQGQTYFVESEYEYPLVPGMPQPEGVPPFDSLRGPDIDLSDLGTIEESAALVDEAGLTVG